MGERVLLDRPCPYCRSPRHVTAEEYAENPYCSKCLHARLQNAYQEIGPGKMIRDGSSFVWVSEVR